MAEVTARERELEARIKQVRSQARTSAGKYGKQAGGVAGDVAGRAGGAAFGAAGGAVVGVVAAPFTGGASIAAGARMGAQGGQRIGGGVGRTAGKTAGKQFGKQVGGAGARLATTRSRSQLRGLQNARRMADDTKSIQDKLVDTAFKKPAKMVAKKVVLWLLITFGPPLLAVVGAFAFVVFYILILEYMRGVATEYIASFLGL